MELRRAGHRLWLASWRGTGAPEGSLRGASRGGGGQKESKEKGAEEDNHSLESSGAAETFEGNKSWAGANCCRAEERREKMVG